VHQQGSLAVSDRSSRNFGSAAYLALLLLCVVTVFWKVALTKQYTLMAWSDSAGQTYPWSQFMAATLHNHSFPFWDPFTDGGRPFLGEAQTGVYYPFNLAFAALPLDKRGLLSTGYITAFILLHCFLASVFIFLLGRRLRLSPFSSAIAAMAYTYSGSVARRSFAQINLFYGTVWIPAVFLFYFAALAARTRSKRFLLANLAGFCLALSFLAGHHQPVLYCGIGLAFTAVMLWFWSHPGEDQQGMNFPRRVTASVTLLVFLFAGLYSAPQLIPSFEYSSQALRWVDVVENQHPVPANATLPYSIAGKFILHPRDLVLLLFANYSPVDNPPYLGILPLFFLLFSIVLLPTSHLVRWCWLVLLLFVALSLGSYSPLHGLFYLLVPFYRATRAAQRNLVMAHLAGALLAGFGCDAFLKSLSSCRASDRTDGLWRRPVRWLLALSLTITAIVSGMYIGQVRLMSSPGYDGLFFACLLLLASSALFCVRGSGLIGQRTLLVGIMIILLFDYHAFLSPYIQPKSGFDRLTNFEPGRYYQEDDVLRFLNARAGNARVAFRGSYYPNPIGDVYRMETISGTEATRLKSMVDMGTSENAENILGVKYIISEQRLTLPVAFAAGKNKVYENPRALPRAWLVYKLSAGTSSAAVAQKLGNPDFDPSREALVAEATDELQPELNRLPQAGSAYGSGRTDFQWLSPNHFRLTTENQQTAFLVISEASYPGWTAIMNGRSQRVFRTDGALIGLFVQSGRRVIDFVFRPKYLVLSLALPLLALAFLLAAIACETLRTHPRSLSAIAKWHDAVADGFQSPQSG
jgi:membrane protein YfhO